MPFNGPARELRGGGDHREESVYCTMCGTIFVPHAPRRSCPACTLADRLDALEDSIDGGDA